MQIMHIPKHVLLSVATAAPALLLGMAIASYHSSAQPPHVALNKVSKVSISQPSKSAMPAEVIAPTPDTGATLGNSTAMMHANASPPTPLAPANNGAQPNNPPVSNPAPASESSNNQPGNEQILTLTLPYLMSYTKGSTMVPDPGAGWSYYDNQCSATWNDGFVQTWNVGPPEYYPPGNTGTVSCTQTLPSSEPKH